jgi:hypothetical protein
MLLLTAHRPDADKMAVKMGIAKALKNENVPAILRCYIQGDCIFCLDDPTWVAALVVYGVPTEIEDYALDAVIETHWKDVGKDGKATVLQIVEYVFSDIIHARSLAYYISDKPQNGYLYCTNYAEIRDIAQRRAQAGMEQEEE